MVDTDFEKIENSIALYDWFHFGDKHFECPGLREGDPEFYEENDKLPQPCDNCCKALIFWEDNYSEQNVKNFLDLINSLETAYVGKFIKGVVVFYFKRKTAMQEFLAFIKDKMRDFDVKGRIEWRRACKKYQRLKPELWKNSKEFILKQEHNNINKM